MVARQTPVPSSEATVEASPRFSVSAADVGWARYEAPTGDFSLALPPSWTRYTKRIEGLGPELKFAAWGVSYESHGNPWLYVFKRPVDSWLEAKTYFEHVRLRVVLDPVTVRVSELTEIEFLDGVGYSFTSVHKGAGAGVVAPKPFTQYFMMVTNTGWSSWCLSSTRMTTTGCSTTS